MLYFPKKLLRMSEYSDVLEKLTKFRDDREWNQFHDSKNLALAILIEASELNELFLWKKEDEIEKVNIDKLMEELADVLSFSFLLAEKHNLNIFDIISKKIDLNAKKYPISKAKGVSTKYTDL